MAWRNDLNHGLDFLIIGAQKGGSTLLALGIAEHPAVWMPNDEIPIFRDPIYTPRGVDEFRSALDSVHPAQILGIKCPDYLGRPEVPMRLAKEPTMPKLVVCLRDPVARAISTYFWHVRWGLLPVEDPAIGITTVLDGGYEGINPRAHEIMEWGLYGRHLTHYLEFFPPDLLHVSFNDDLATSPARIFSAAFRFLGIDESFHPEVEHKRVNEGVYARRRLRFLNLRNRYILKWSDDRTYVNIGPASGAWPRLVSAGVAAADRWLLARFFSNQRPDLPAELIRRMRDYYRDDVVRLEEIVHRDLAAWQTPAA